MENRSISHRAGESGRMPAIPWLSRWDEKANRWRAQPSDEDRLTGILSDLEFRTMLEELEFH